MDLAITIFWIGVGLGALLVGIGVMHDRALPAAAWRGTRVRWPTTPAG